MKTLLALLLLIPSLSWGNTLNKEIISNQLSNINVQGLFLIASLFFFIYLDWDNRLADWLISIYHIIYFLFIFIILNILLYFIQLFGVNF
tara:strand:+ start:140 stop:409 length:270 start_codon:yes stop_codon:yes gene_type:complete